MGLRAIKTEEAYGLIFVNFDDQSPSLAQSVGRAWAIIEDVIGASRFDVFHYHRFVINANWKQWQETNMELYHEWAHHVNRRTSILADGYFDRKWEIHENGHGWLTPFVVKYSNYKGWKERDSKPLPGLKANEYRILDLFPNISIQLRSTVLRIDTSTPLGPNRTLVEFRGLGLKDETDEDRAIRQKHHNQFWGPFGRNLPEDVHLVEGVAPNNRSKSAKHALVCRDEGMKTQDDEVIRAYYRTWGRYMGRSASDPLRRRAMRGVVSRVDDLVRS
jgi:methanesulfonate monooxygenase large subunit